MDPYPPGRLLGISPCPSYRSKSSDRRRRPVLCLCRWWHYCAVDLKMKIKIESERKQTTKKKCRYVTLFNDAVRGPLTGAIPSACTGGGITVL